MINIILTTQTEHLKEKLMGLHGVNIISLGKNKDNERLFPDGEVYAHIAEINKLTGRTIILHSGAPNPNSGLMELKMILEILKRSKADPVEVFFTYFPYGMQDKIKKPGELNMAETLIKELTDYHNVKNIYVIDSHFKNRDWVRHYPLINISALDILKQKASQDYSDIIYLAPDIGSQKRTGLMGTKKNRTDSYIVNIKSDKLFQKAVKNKVIGAVDDLLETGGTMDRFHDECLKYGAREAVALVTHGVLEQGIDKIQRKYSRLYLTNTVRRDSANVDIVELILKTIL